jgi:hypothetical protein
MQCPDRPASALPRERVRSLILSHIFLFLGRLGFVFGSALFSIVLFRHLPDLGPDIDILLGVRRAIWVAFSLFALFCVTLELERLGAALGGRSSEKS